MDNFAIYFGAFSILSGLTLVILPFIFSRMFDDSNYIPRMIGTIQILGGILTAGSVLMPSVFVASFFVLVGISSIIMSWCVAYGLRTQRPKRKSKPKKV